ncbi:hypothetical protein D6821_02045 [Candidatus Parcubacteria bacterium]|nr:MAG: hypothetical protein D6821_02045 [Candidatus Parcubacteria bacterium]
MFLIGVDLRAQYSSWRSAFFRKVGKRQISVSLSLFISSIFWRQLAPGVVVRVGRILILAISDYLDNNIILAKIQK